jgi:hypothetical protein
MKLWKVTKTALLPATNIESGDLFISNLGSIFRCMGKGTSGIPEYEAILPGKDRTQPSTIFNINVELDGVEAFRGKEFSINPFLVDSKLVRLLYNNLVSYLKLNDFSISIGLEPITDFSKLSDIIGIWEEVYIGRVFKP